MDVFYSLQFCFREKHYTNFGLTFETLHPLASSKRNLKIFSLTLTVTKRD